MKRQQIIKKKWISHLIFVVVFYPILFNISLMKQPICLKNTVKPSFINLILITQPWSTSYRDLKKFDKEKFIFLFKSALFKQNNKIFFFFSNFPGPAKYSCTYNQWQKLWEKLLFGQFRVSTPFPPLTILRNNQQSLRQAISTLYRVKRGTFKHNF